MPELGHAGDDLHEGDTDRVGAATRPAKCHVLAALRERAPAGIELRLGFEVTARPARLRPDDDPLDEEALGLVQQMDERAITAAASGDAERWYDTLAAEENATRICGFAPTYCMLRCAEPGEGRPLYYAESPEPDGSVVTVAAMVWPGSSTN